MCRNLELQRQTVLCVCASCAHAACLLAVVQYVLVAVPDHGLDAQLDVLFYVQRRRVVVLHPLIYRHRAHLVQPASIASTVAAAAAAAAAATVVIVVVVVRRDLVQVAAFDDTATASVGEVVASTAATSSTAAATASTVAVAVAVAIAAEAAAAIATATSAGAGHGTHHGVHRPCCDAQARWLALAVLVHVPG